MPPRSISGVTPPMSGRGEGGDPGDRAAYAGSMGTISGFSMGSVGADHSGDRWGPQVASR